jgi:hypothetical protein
MEEELSVKEALEDLRSNVRRPAYIAVAVTLGIGLLVTSFMSDDIFELFGFPGGCVWAVLVGWIVWSRRYLRWKIWALTYVRNVHELRRCAEVERLYIKDGGVVDFFIFKTAAERSELKELAKRFDQPEIMTDDTDVPDEVRIHISKVQFRIVVVAAVVIMVSSSAFFLFYHLMFGLIWLVFGIGLGKFLYDINQNEKPLILINKQGIGTRYHPFSYWHEISNENIVLEQNGETSSYELRYDDINQGKVAFQIIGADTTPSEIMRLLLVYRKQYELGRIALK